MRMSFRRRLLAAGLTLALTGTRSQAQTGPTMPLGLPNTLPPATLHPPTMLPPATLQPPATVQSPATLQPPMEVGSGSPWGCPSGRPGKHWKYGLQDRCLGYPGEFNAPPLGYWVAL